MAIVKSATASAARTTAAPKNRDRRNVSAIVTRALLAMVTAAAFTVNNQHPQPETYS
jgi:hypothetical protein